MAKDTAISISFKISEDANGLKRITADAAELRKAMGEAVKVSTELQTSFVNFAAFATSFRAGADSLRQLSDTIGNLTGESAEFNKAMRAANTMAGRDAAGFGQLKGEVAALAKEIPIARDQLANGLYQVISNGVPEDNWIEFLNKSARSAVGGIADINKVVTVTSTLIKNYGLEWSAAGDIQDKIQLTAKNGVTSFELLAQALPRVTGNAATLGVSVEELLGTFATLTGVSGNTAEVSTQLAAVFTALVKPSSEAAEMAAKMGIEFNAAAIKGAGGFGKFLSQLDSSIKAYSQANGVLEQEVYSKLFGSAEALRALIPLQGELAGKFQANVAEMVNSAGTMDAAYGEMASTGEATAQRLQNSLGAVTDRIAGFTAPVKPFIDLGAGALSAGANVVILAEGYRKLHIIQKLSAVSGKALKSVLGWISQTCKKTRLGLEMLAVSEGKAAAASAALKIALRGLLVASGVGLAIMAVTTVIGHLSDASDEAAESTNKLLSAEERAKRDAEQLEQLRQQEDSTLKQTRASLELNIQKLKEFNGTKEQEKTLVAEMNDTYGKSMGYFSSVADWYKALISNSEAYCKQMIIEARTRTLADQIAAKQRENDKILYNDDGSRRKYSKRRRLTYDPGDHTLIGAVTGKSLIASNPHYEQSDFEKATGAYQSNLKAIAHLTEQLEKSVKEANEISFSVKGGDVRPELPGITPPPNSLGNAAKPDKNATIRPEEDNAPIYRADASNLKEYEENIKALQILLETASEEEAAMLNPQIAMWREKANAVRNAGLAVESNAPKYRADASNLAQISENISVLTDQLNTASIEEAAAINQEIQAWNKKADAIRNAGLEAKSTFDTFREGWGGIKGIEGGIEGITDALNGNGNAWQRVSGIVEGFIQIYEGIKTVVAIMNILNTVTQAQAAARVTEAAATTEAAVAQGAGAVTAEAAAAAQAPVAAANEVITASYMKLAAAAYYAAHAYIPFVGFGIASGFVSAAAGVVKGIGKVVTATPFANGGVVSGPTVGLIGEYAGASNNPEVVAPLDKLRKLMTPAGAPVIVGGTLRASGRELVCVLANETRIASKSGRKTNIKI